MLSPRIHSLPILKLCAWSGIVWMVLFLAGFSLSGFLVPPDPSDGANEIARMFADDRGQIRAGMIISAISIPFLAPFSVLITMQMRRIEGRHSALAWIQLMVAAVFMLEFLIYIYFWQAATFRPERDAELLLLVNDLAWLPFVGLTSTLVFQVGVFAIAILMDKRERPVFPRWFGWFNLWAAIVFMPGSYTVCFKDGPLAWNGLIAWWLVITVYFLYTVLSVFFLLRAVKQQAGEEGVEAPPMAVMAAVE